ncbi:MAG: DUF2807 domain-containing protein [Chitinophagaceae bacterium]|nr:DUF2807 domain-containing protein [Chitinophagaceae bacterium]
MKKSVVFFLSLFLSVAIFAQKQIDDANAQVRKVSGFHAIKSSHGIKVYLTQSNSEAVAVSANSTEYRDKMKTVVENGVLRIYFDNDDWKLWQHITNKQLRAYVSVKELDRIDVSSGSSVQIEDVLNSNKLVLDASSGASIKGKVDAESMTVDQSSGSVITISGQIKGTLKVEGNSGSIFHGFDLSAENCDAETNSGAGIKITVNKELTVDASSGGYIHYKGNGSIKDVHTSSGGSVSRKS